MIKEKLKSNNMDDLIRNVIFITLVASVFLLIAVNIGAYVSDYLTKSSCSAIDETYIEGKYPGSGTCIKSTDTVDIKK